MDIFTILKVLYIVLIVLRGSYRIVVCRFWRFPRKLFFRSVLLPSGDLPPFAPFLVVVGIVIGNARRARVIILTPPLESGGAGYENTEARRPFILFLRQQNRKTFWAATYTYWGT